MKAREQPAMSSTKGTVAGTSETTAVRLVMTNARCHPVGESHGRHRYPAHAVAQARQLRADGLLLREVAAAIGCSLTTAWWWTAGPGRPAPARVLVKLGPPRERVRPLRAPSKPAAGAASARFDCASASDSARGGES